MTDRPIIFSAPMIKALLDGRKSQTRCIATVKWKDGANQDFTGWRPERVGAAHWQLIGGMGVGANITAPCAPGDRLWVREAHALVPSSAYRMSDGVAQAIDPADADRACVYREGWERCAPRWRPSIHMPRWASRLTLVVTDVRVQRLQDITEADAVAEGAEVAKGTHGIDGGVMVRTENPYVCATPGLWYRSLWNSIHGPDAWDRNPWVEAITFETHRCNIDQMGESHG